MIPELSGTELNAMKAAWRAYCASEAEASGRELSVGLAATFTVDPFVPYLGMALIDSGFRPSISVAPYNQIHQVCLDPSSAFDGELPDCLCVLWRIDDLLAMHLDAWVHGDPASLERADDELARLASLIRDLESNFDGELIVSTPPFPTLPEYSATDLDMPTAAGRFHHHITLTWLDLMSQLDAVQLLDLDSLQRGFGTARSIDIRKWYLYKQPFAERFVASMALQLGRIIRSLHVPAKKCIAVDCDNTLWGGIIGEDGLSGIDLGHNFPGSAFRDFQQLLLRWKKQGILIALLSKNNEEDVWEVFDNHDGMVLQKSDIAAWRVNWNAKPSNLAELADELNFGIDAFVFIDDNAFEIEQMKAAYPDEVNCFHIPEETSYILPELKRKRWFDKTTVSDEDAKRTEMVVNERDRRSLQQSLTPEEFVASLEIRISLIEVQPEHIGRVAQLINKTNQFNLSTRRRSESEVRALVQSPKHLVLAARIEDRFGDYGIGGVAIIEIGSETWAFDTFLLSCRVLGRRVETAILAKLAERARSQGITAFQAEYIPTAKNKLIETFLSTHGFAPNNGIHTLKIDAIPAQLDAITIDYAQ